MIGDAAEAAATGYLAGGPGASGDGLVPQSPDPAAGKKAGWKQAGPGWTRGLYLVGRESIVWLAARKRDWDWLGQAGQGQRRARPTHRARPGDGRLTAVVLHYRQPVVLVVVVARSGQGYGV